MKILLINPPLLRKYIKSNDEPLHLEYLATPLKDSHDVVILDSFGLKVSVKETVETALNVDADVVGISLGFAAAYLTITEIAASIKKHSPETVIVLGGNTASFLKDELILRPEIDLIVRGEGDISFKETIQALDAYSMITEVKGISVCVDGKAIHTEDQPLVKNVDSLPFPDRSMVPCPEYYSKVVLAARGCSYGCAYCSASAFWQSRFRSRSVDNILQEVDMLANTEDLSYFSFADDCFTLRPKRVFEICDGLEKMKLDSTWWSCTGRIETISSELLEKMGRAGCRHMFFGIESGSERILKKLHRKYTPGDVLNVYRECLENGIRPTFSFIVGLPFEERADFEKTCGLIQKLEGVESGTHILTPFPGTPIAMNPEKYGLDISAHDVADLDINTKSYIHNGHLTQQETEEAFRDAMGHGFRSLRKTRTLREISPDLEI